MPTPVPVGSLVRVRPQYTIEGQECENVWYFENTVADADMVLHLLRVIAQCFITNLLPVLGDTFTLDRVRGMIVGPALGAEDVWEPVPGDTVQGAVATDTLPSFTSCVISLKTAHPGRTGRGRFYLGGIVAADTSGSLIKIESPTWVHIAAFIACIVAAFPNHELGGDAMYQWVMYSHKDGGATKDPLPPAGIHPVVRVVPHRELGTTRRRKLGRGR